MKTSHPVGRKSEAHCAIHARLLSTKTAKQ